jgi:hypothetical protein
MGILKTRKNKKFDYQPRYFDDKGEGNPFQIEHKFDKFRSTVGPSGGLKGKFVNAMSDFKDVSSRGTNKTILIIISILVFFSLYIIDFDLSIFLPK